MKLAGWLDTGSPRAWHSVRCVMFIPDISLSLLYTTQGHLDCWFLTWPYLAAVWRRHLSPSLLASLSLSLVFSTNHRTVSCRPYWNKHNTSITWLYTGSWEGLTKWATVKRGSPENLPEPSLDFKVLVPAFEKRSLSAHQTSWMTCFDTWFVYTRWL